MNAISSRTCIRFRQRNGDADYVYIQRGSVNSGCWSYVGRVGGGQILNLQVPEYPGAAHCVWTGTVSHELIHAIGYYHEQSRPDRDDFVEINWSNIPTGLGSYLMQVTNQTITNLLFSNGHRCRVQLRQVYMGGS